MKTGDQIVLFQSRGRPAVDKIEEGVGKKAVADFSVLMLAAERLEAEKHPCSVICLLLSANL